jgi:sensor domain CHASE-containing protein
MVVATVATTPQVLPALVAVVVVVVVAVATLQLEARVAQESSLYVTRCQVCPRQFWIQLTTLELHQPTRSLL